MVLMALLVFVLVVTVLTAPLITIWALNLLFGFAIPFTVPTYLAAMWLSAVLAARANLGNSK